MISPSRLSTRTSQALHASLTPPPLFSTFSLPRLPTTYSNEQSTLLRGSDTTSSWNSEPKWYSAPLASILPDPFQSSPSNRTVLQHSALAQEGVHSDCVDLNDTHRHLSSTFHSLDSVLKLYTPHTHQQATLTVKVVGAPGRFILEQTATKLSKKSSNAFSVVPADVSLGVSNKVLHSQTPSSREIATSKESNTSDTQLTLFGRHVEESNPTPTYSSDTSGETFEPQTPTPHRPRYGILEIVDAYESSDMEEELMTPSVSDLKQTAPFESAKIGLLQRTLKAETVSSLKTDKTEPSDATTRSTPPRNIFDDLETAYSYIRSRSTVKLTAVNSSAVELPLPPIPIPLRNRSPTPSYVPDRPVSKPPIYHDPRKSKPVTRYSQRLSRFFQLNNAAGDEKSGYILPSLPHESSVGPRNSFVEYSPSRPSSVPGQFPPSIQRTSSFGINSSGHYYNDDSLLVSSGTPGKALPARNGSHEEQSEMSNGTENTSTGRLIDSYYDRPTQSKTTLEHSVTPRRHSDCPLSDSFKYADQSATVESTIANLLNHYGQHKSSPTRSKSSSHRAIRRWSHSPSIPSSAVTESSSWITTSGLSCYEFRDRCQSGVDPKVASRIYTQRQSTHRDVVHAHESVAKAAPLEPLPADPSFATGEVSSGPSLDPPGIPSGLFYGDTRDLLRLSQSSIEIGRGAGGSTLSDRSDSPVPFESIPQARTQDDERIRRSSTISFVPSEHKVQRLSARTLEDTVTRDINHLSALSGYSSIRESIYYLGGVVAGETALRNQMAQETHRTSSPHSKSTKEEQTPRVTPTKSIAIPFAAFSQNAVMPGSKRFSSVERESLYKRVSTTQDSLSLPCPNHEVRISDNERKVSAKSMIGEDVADDHDWVTIPDSRPTLRSLYEEGDSFADYSDTNSLGTFRHVGVHPANNNYQHVYRMHSGLGLDEPVLLPTYNFGAVGSFPYRNSPIRPTPTSLATAQTYRHPAPLPEFHNNPFTSSPPPLPRSPSAQSSAPHYAFEPDYVESQMDHNAQTASASWRKPQLSVVYENTRENSTKLLHYNPTTPKPSVRGSRTSTEHSSDWLSSGPGPEINTEINQLTPISPVLNSSRTAGLIERLRRDDPRMASTPLSATNSFAKLAKLGPRANITGTPNGTGMREVGSSLVGSSSPFNMPGSSPQITHWSTPDTVGSVVRHVGRSPPLFVDPLSPLAEYDENRFGTHSNNVQSMTRGRKQLNHFKEAMLGSSRSDSHARAAVAGQKHLMQISLVDGMDSNVLTNVSRVREPFDRPSYRAGSSNATNRPLIPTIHRPSPLLSPHLQRRYRSPSSHRSGIAERKQRLSWLCLAAFALLPPLLVLYGYGYLDAFMLFISGREIEHFGTRQKRIAKWAGFSVTSGLVVGISVFWIVVRSVPNDLPR